MAEQKKYEKYIFLTASEQKKKNDLQCCRLNLLLIL